MNKAVNDKRPVNLDISTIKLPFPAYISILHRISGVILFAGVAVLLWMLDASLSSPDGFAAVKACLESFFVKLIVWGVVSAFIYHTVAGIRHLVMDLGFGETLEGGLKGAQIVAGISAVLIIIAGGWIW